MLDWLVKRLSPVKDAEERWVDFATALQTYWEGQFDPSGKRLIDLRSVYTSSDADLRRRIREYGDYFAYDMPRIDDRPIAVAWRKRELQFKDTEEIVSSTFRRHYSDLPVSWIPLYAPRNKAYGTEFVDGETIEKFFLPEESYFLTSRGILSTDLGHLHQMGVVKDDFIAQATAVMARTKPLHIVFGGFVFYVTMPIDFPLRNSSLTCSDFGADEFIINWTSNTDRFDYTAADVANLDDHNMQCECYVDRNISIPFMGTYEQRLWKLDMRFSESFPAGLIPLDLERFGVEGQEIPHLELVYSNVVGSPDVMPVKAFTPAIYREPAKIYSIGYNVAMEDEKGTTMECALDSAVLWDEQSPRIDKFVKFDEIPADFAPLDGAVGGLIYG